MNKNFLISAFILLNIFCFSQNSPAQDLNSEVENFNEFSEDLLDYLENPRQKEFDPSIQQKFTISGIGKINLNAHTASFNSDSQVLNGLYEGLFSNDPKTSQAVLALAESYKISRNKKRWTFKIRENAFLSNGEKITAQTIIDSWLKLQKTPDSPYASLLDCVKGIKEFRENKIPAKEVGLRVSGNNLVMILNSPTPYLPNILCHYAFSVFTGDENISSGAFYLSQKNEDSLLLKKNEKYWDAENVALNEIEVLFSSDKNQNAFLYNTGKVNWLYSEFDSSMILNQKALVLSTLFGTSYLFFTCRNPIWDNVEFRSALFSAIPWNELRKGNYIAATTLIFPLTGYPQVEGYSETDLDEAKYLMKEARKNAGIEEDKILDLTFGISDTPYMKEIALLLKNAFEPLGVNLIPFKISPDDYFSNIPYLNYDIFSYSWIGDFADPISFLELFRDGSTLNQSKWKNQKFSEFLDKANNTLDSLERYKYLSQAEQLLLDDAIVIPINHSIMLQTIDLERIGGWYANAIDVHPLKTIYFKEYKNNSIPNIVKK